MMSPTRYIVRNAYFCNPANPGVSLGGFYQNGAITERNFLAMLEILLVADRKPLCVQARISGNIVTETNLRNYDIYFGWIYFTRVREKNKGATSARLLPTPCSSTLVSLILSGPI